jgi:hypothetical protein
MPGFLEPIWETVFRLATWAALIFGALSIGSAFVSAWVGWEITDATQKDADKKIKEADERIAEFNERAKTAELKLEQLRKVAGPRSIDNTQFLKALEGVPKSRIQIWYMPTASDGYWLANQIVSAVISAGWPLVEPPTIIPDAPLDKSDAFSRFQNPLMALGAQPSGVTVVAKGSPSDIDAPHPSLDALMEALAKGMGSSAAGSFNPSVPEGTLRVIIAVKPDPIISK